MRQILDTEDIAQVVAEVSGKNVYERGQLADTTHDPGVLLLLANDDESFVRAMVSLNRATPQKALEKLAQDHDFQVSRIAIENFSLALPFLKALSTRNGATADLAKAEIARRRRVRSTKYRASRMANRLTMRARHALWGVFHPVVRAMGLCPTCNSMNDDGNAYDWGED